MWIQHFLTYTCNQSTHPGISHLFKWKESKEWTSFVKGYTDFESEQQREVDLSMEMAYSNILTRCWLEVRRLWLEFIIRSSKTKLKRVLHAFFRDEYQESSGNLSHVHGLVGLDHTDMNNKEFLQFVCSLQKNCVADIVTAEEVKEFINNGLFQKQNDWSLMKEEAEKILSHTRHSRRCLIRKGHSGTDDDYRCRKIHPVFDSKNPLIDEFQPLPIEFSDRCLNILQRIGLWSPPTPDQPKGSIHHDLLDPKRHVGVVHPSARENMSPVTSEHFAFTRSMQNMQIIAGQMGWLAMSLR